MKSVTHQNRTVEFICRAFDYNAYRVYDRDTRETRELRRWDDGRTTRGAGAPYSQHDYEALCAFIEAERVEFQQWLTAHPERAQYA